MCTSIFVFFGDLSSLCTFNCSTPRLFGQTPAFLCSLIIYFAHKTYANSNTQLAVRRCACFRRSYFRYPLYIVLSMVLLSVDRFRCFENFMEFILAHSRHVHCFGHVLGLHLWLVLPLFWVIEHNGRSTAEEKLEDRKPNLDLSIESAIWVYEKESNQTVFVLASYLLNRGEPTIAMSWTAKYQCGEKTENMAGSYLRDSYHILVGKDQLTLTNENLLSPQVFIKRLEKGEGKMGRILFTVPGNRLNEIATAKWRIAVQCKDFEGTFCSAEYGPSGVPLTTTLMYPGRSCRSI